MRRANEASTMRCSMTPPQCHGRCCPPPATFPPTGTCHATAPAQLSLGVRRCSRAMRTKPKWTLTVASSLLFAVGCSSSIVSIAARSSRDWQFVQSVGGIAVGTPTRDSRGHVLLPIRCDVSGTQTVTVRPTAINSALVCESPTTRVRGSTVLLTIRTTIASSHNSNAHCPTADLGALSTGEYSVIYLSPDGSQHPIGSFQIPRQ